MFCSVGTHPHEAHTELDVAVDGLFVSAFRADGLIVSSPTGSTAYSLSARGPILAPDMRALILTPVSPHMLFDRSLILEASTVLTISVTERPAALTIDGRAITVPQGTSVMRAASQRSQSSTFATCGSGAACCSGSDTGDLLRGGNQAPDLGAFPRDQHQLLVAGV